MWILGVNGKPVAYHDSSACLIDENGAIYAFSEEERFTRQKHGILSAPIRSAEFCMSSAGLQPEDIDVIAIGWDIPKLRRVLSIGESAQSESDLISAILGSDFAKRARAKLEFVPHHLAHAAAAFYGSGFERAAVLIVDGVGETDSISIIRADRHGGLKPERSWPSTHSLGFMYEAATQWLGYNFLEAGKTMALAAYHFEADSPEADSRIVFRVSSDDIEPLWPLKLTSSYGEIRDAWRQMFSTMVGRNAPLCSAGELDRDGVATQVAFSAQATVEHVYLHLAELARSSLEVDALCVAGGVALNSVANAKIPEPIYVPPIPHDAGVALGAAWYLFPPKRPEFLCPYLGFEILREADKFETTGFAGKCEDVSTEKIISRLIQGEVGAIVNGRAEIGPRALCHRSIVSAATSREARDRLNALKGREPWRPFGPVASQPQTLKFWEHKPLLSRYMAGAVRMTELGKSVAPAACHVDGTTRPQTITDSDCPLISGVLSGLERAGLPPVLLNTSFNSRGQPIVNDAGDAFSTFEMMKLDFLVLHDLLFVANSGNCRVR